MGISKEGSAYLSLSDNSGKTKLVMQVFLNGDSALAMKDKTGKLNILLSLANDSPSLILKSKDSNGGLTLGGTIVQDKDCPGLLLVDKTGKKRALLSIMDDFPVLFLNGKDENPRAMVAVTKEESARIKLTGKDGNGIFEAP